MIVPRWSAKLMDAVNDLPLRERVWADTRVVLGNSLSATALRDLFAGREVAAEEVQGERSVRVAAAFAEFPVAALTHTT